MKRFVFFFGVLAVVACGNEKPPAAPPPPPPLPTAAPKTVAPATATPPPAFDGQTLVKNACLSCHQEDMLAQQRITAAQWTKVVTKMKGWGADLDEKEIVPLSTWLAEHYGPDAGAWQAPRASAAEIGAELDKTSDGPFASGDVARGKELYASKCSACHGADGRGDMGTILVDRPFLWRASSVADVVRKGRGKMPAMNLSDAQIADVLAHLRTLKNPLP